MNSILSKFKKIKSSPKIAQGSGKAGGRSLPPGCAPVP